MKTKIEFVELTSASFGSDVYLIAHTEYMVNREIKFMLKPKSEKFSLERNGQTIYVNQNGKDVQEFTATVGQFSKENPNIDNAKEYENYAITRIKLSPSNFEKKQSYKEFLAKNKKVLLFLKIDAEPIDIKWYEVIYENIFKNRPKLWYYGSENWFELKDNANNSSNNQNESSNENSNPQSNLNEYRIYSDGRIEKIIYDKENKLNKYKYVYYDASNVRYEICEAVRNITKEKKNGIVYKSKPTHQRVEYDKKVNEGSTIRRVKYVNGDIAEYGSHPTKGLIWRLYKSTNKDIEVVRMPDFLSYKKGEIVVNYKFTKTKRRYTGADTFAGFIGALVECRISLFTTGSCFKEASCFPSAEHVNGKSVDTLYKWKINYDQKIIDGMNKYHFRKILVGSGRYFKSLKRCSNGGRLHNSHLHSGNFDKSKVKIIKKY